MEIIKREKEEIRGQFKDSIKKYNELLDEAEILEAYSIARILGCSISPRFRKK